MLTPDDDDGASRFNATSLAEWLRGYDVVWMNWSPFFTRPAPRAWLPFRGRTCVPLFARSEALRRPPGVDITDWPD